MLSRADNNNNNSLSMFVPQIVLVLGVLCRRRRRWAGRKSILLYYTAHRDRRVLKESASRGAVAEMQAQQPRRQVHVLVDQITFRWTVHEPGTSRNVPNRFQYTLIKEVTVHLCIFLAAAADINSDN